MPRNWSLERATELQTLSKLVFDRIDRLQVSYGSYSLQMKTVLTNLLCVSVLVFDLSLLAKFKSKVYLTAKFKTYIRV